MPTPVTRRAAFGIAASAVSSFTGITLLAACGIGQPVGVATVPSSSTATAARSSVSAVSIAATSATAASSMEYSANAKQFPNAFLGGQIGLRQMDKEQVAPARHDLSTAAFALGMAPIYSGPAGRINRMGPLAFGIPREAKNADAGWRWTRFMGGPDAATVLMLAQSTLPVRPDFAKLPAFATSMQPWENGAMWLDSMAHGRALVQPANYAQVATLWTQTWTDILARKAVVQTLLDDFVRQANAALAKAS
jgi:hypothetical protein